MSAQAASRLDFSLWQRFASGHGMSVLLVGLLLLSVAWPVQSARWAPGMAPTTLVTLLALALFVMSDALRWPRLHARMAALTVGAALVIASAIAVMPEGSLGTRAAGLAPEVLTWLGAIGSQEVLPGQVEFAILITSLFWTLGFWGAGQALRRRQAWLLILPAGLVQGMTLANVAGGAALWLATFMAASLALLIHTSTLRRQDVWRERGIEYAPSLALSHSAFILGFGVAAVLLVSTLPVMPWTPFDGAARRTQSAADAFEETFGRLFNALPSRRHYVTLTYEGETTLRGNPQLTDQRLFSVVGPPQLWRARAYTDYTGSGWATDAAEFIDFAPQEAATGDRVVVRHEFRMDAATDSLFSGGQPLRFDAPALALASPDAPWDVLQVKYGEGLDYFKTRLNLRYRSEGAALLASAQRLRESAEEPYPDWVADAYLQLPETLPQRVHDLALEAAEGAETPYDQALAVRDYLLANYRYELDVPQPPEGSDGVDFFLFETRQGYCDYYASAMVVLMRSLGIPTRYVLGYAAGQYDPGRNEYVVREFNYHAWPEVYFPGFGWLPFEPTPPEAIEFGGTPADAADLRGGIDAEFDEAAFLEDQPGSVPVGVVATGGGGFSQTLLAALALAGLLLAAAVFLYHRVWWRLAELDRTAEIYGKMARLGALLGMPPRPHQTPLEYGRALAGRMPSHAWAVLDISEAYAAYRYSPWRVSMSQRLHAEHAWGRLRGALLRMLLRPGR
ncbi:MAG: transglutaminase domain-containing protein [Chloroflexota bacterium]|nr:transglutaminase domain-containing protein [Chloroflexota bacterium]